MGLNVLKQRMLGGRFPNQGVSNKHQAYLHSLHNQMNFQLPVHFSKSSFWAASFFVREIFMFLFQTVMHALDLEKSHIHMTLVYQSG